MKITLKSRLYNKQFTTTLIENQLYCACKKDTYGKTIIAFIVTDKGVAIERFHFDFDPAKNRADGLNYKFEMHSTLNQDASEAFYQALKPGFDGSWKSITKEQFFTMRREFFNEAFEKILSL